MADIYLGEDETANQPQTLKRKRIRRLIDEPDEGRKRYRRSHTNSKEMPKISTIQRCSKRVFVTCSIIALMLAVSIGNFFNDPELRSNGLIAHFVSNYQKHFYQIVNSNKNYCDEEINVEKLAADIRQDDSILHQNKAQLDIQATLHYDRKLISIALVGPVGVGKNLYANTLQKHFPWPQNVKSYIWNTFVRHENEKYRSLHMIIEYFSECGVNLLIIRNLTPADKPLVEYVNDIILENNHSRQKRVIVIFIFNLNTMLSDSEYLEQFESLQKLKYTTTVNFKAFGKEELKDCILRESKLENMTLSCNVFDELLETIDVKGSGCKNVNAKVLAYGTKLSRSKTLGTNENDFSCN